MKNTKNLLLVSYLFLALIALSGVGNWLYQTNVPWKTYSFSLGGKNVATINYPDKYQNALSNNASLPDQKVGLFSIANVINFQLSNESRDKDIKTYISSVILRSGSDEGSISNAALDSSQAQNDNNTPQNDTSTIDTNYKKTKYGRNKVYFINEYNKSADFVVGDIFDGHGHRLNFTYHSKNVKAWEIKSMISKIKF